MNNIIMMHKVYIFQPLLGGTEFFKKIQTLDMKIILVNCRYKLPNSFLV